MRAGWGRISILSNLDSLVLQDTEKLCFAQKANYIVLQVGISLGLHLAKQSANGEKSDSPQHDQLVLHY